MPERPATIAESAAKFDALGNILFINTAPYLARSSNLNLKRLDLHLQLVEPQYKHCKQHLYRLDEDEISPFNSATLPIHASRV